MSTLDSDAHGSLGGPAADQLRAYIARLEEIETRVEALNAEKGEVYAEAKACGLCRATMRKLVLQRRKEQAEVQEEDVKLQLYRDLLVGFSLP